ncbi:MAG: GTP cyclohydrolase II [Spirochaetaceae bacterium]|jgi:3,4-dihydroxy 2-butanone 4-phosphate synthase/GTP cyclohydrolase II|nr:GTP cyclohydrolase II [Spirochaetaceae bacterium]
MILYIDVKEAVKRLSNEEMIILQDSKDRENEGDILFFAQYSSKEKVRFLVDRAKGLICVALSEKKADKLGLTPMVRENNSLHYTAFTQSLDALMGISTGISVMDRNTTISLLGQQKAQPGDFARPGHIFPLIAKEGGILKRPGHTEGAIDLARAAQCEEAVVICEILGKGDSMARGKELMDFAEEEGLGILTIETLMQYFFKAYNTVELPLSQGNFFLNTYPVLGEETQHPLALISQNHPMGESPLVRIHSECMTGDVFGSKRCDCGEQLETSLEILSREGGILIYLRQEGRGIGLIEKMKAYVLQQQGLDTLEANTALGHAADLRDYQTAALILRDLGIQSIKLLTNNPDKILQMENQGFKVERHSLEIQPKKENLKYLLTKKEKFSHQLSIGV